MNQRLGDIEPAPLSTRQPPGPNRRYLGEGHGLQQLPGAHPGVTMGDAVQDPLKGQVLQAVRSSSTPTNWPAYPITARTRCGARATSYPPTVARPEVWRSSVTRIRTVVVLPDPFGPSSPNVSPAATEKLNAVQRRLATGVLLHQVLHLDHRAAARGQTTVHEPPVAGVCGSAGKVRLPCRGFRRPLVGMMGMCP